MDLRLIPSCIYFIKTDDGVKCITEKLVKD